MTTANLQFDFDAAPALPMELAERVTAARYSGKLTDCEASVLDLLVDLPEGPRMGKAKAMQISAMQAWWTRSGLHVWPDRSVKDAAKCLLESFGIPVGSSRQPGNAGYYLVIDDSEAESTVRAWSGEIRSLAIRCKALSPKSSYVKSMLGQLSVELEIEEAANGSSSI